MATMLDDGLDALVLVDETNGFTVIPQLAELRRLNWFDGRLLRADDLRVEQDHMRGLVRRVGRAGGSGVVEGFTCTQGADGRLRVGPGLAVDPSGRTLLLPVEVALDVQELIDRTARKHKALLKAPHALGGKLAAAGAFADCVTATEEGDEVPPTASSTWYVITVGWAEGLCGNEEVYGRLCEAACTTATDRPWRIDGLVFRARPLRPRTPLAKSAVALGSVHERSLVASALFADELADAGSLVFGDGLRSPIWCAGSSPAGAARDEVPLALVGRGGRPFLDAWAVRRERMETPPQRYWDGRLAMRPWAVFLAQVLQFQCQLHDLLADGAAPTPGGGTDPCAERQEALEDVFARLEERIESDGPEDTEISQLRKRVIALRLGAPSSGAAQRVLVDGGIVELPPAGYLPVDPAGPPALEDQVRALLGAGVDLTFCTARHDALARAFEEARHLDRISLLRGLDDPSRREDVEIIVPDAEVAEVASLDAWQGVLETPGGDREQEQRQSLTGQRLGSEGFRLRGAGRVEYRDRFALRWAGAVNEDQYPMAFGEISTDRDPFSVGESDDVPFTAAGDVLVDTGRGELLTRVTLRATLRVNAVEARPGGTLMRGHVVGIASRRSVGPDSTDDTQSSEVRWPATLARRSDRSAVLALEVGRSTLVRVTLEWHGDADAVEAVVYALSRKTSIVHIPLSSFAGEATGLGIEIARLRLEREPDAADPGHPARIASQNTLKRIEDVADDPGFAEDALRRLFPTARRGVRLRPTRDWVLFRRRAVLNCGATVAPVVATNTFAVYAFVDARTAMTHVSQNQFAYLGQVAFAEGSDDLRSGGESVVRAWDALVNIEGEIPAAGTIAGAPGGKELSLSRAEAVVEALDAITPRSDDFQVVEVDPEDLTLDPHGADGVILVGFRRVRSERVAIAFRGVALGDYWDAYYTAIKENRLDDAMEAAFADERVLGTVSFASDSATPESDAEVQAVIKAYNEVLGGQGAPYLATVWSVKGDEEAGPRDLRAERAKGVAGKVGLEGDPDLLEVGEETFQRARDAGVVEPVLVVLLLGLQD